MGTKVSVHAAVPAKASGQLRFLGSTRPRGAKLDACEPWLRKLGSPDVLVHATNIREPDSVDRLLDAAWAHHGRLDVQVNNAGGQFPKAALDITPNVWKAVIDTNLNGTWNMMHAAAKRWRDAGAPGSIVNIVATFQRGMPGVAHTCAARAGVTYLSKTVAVEWAEHGIRVNCIGAGAIESNGFNNYKPENVPGLFRTNPMLKAGDVQDEAVVYLTAPSGKYITGETINIDGGMVLWGEFWPAGMPDYFKPPA